MIKIKIERARSSRERTKRAPRSVTRLGKIRRCMIKTAGYLTVGLGFFYAGEAIGTGLSIWYDPEFGTTEFCEYANTRYENASLAYKLATPLVHAVLRSRSRKGEEVSSLSNN